MFDDSASAASAPSARSVSVHCDDCDVDATIAVPADFADPALGWEHPCGALGLHADRSHVFRGVWRNPDAPVQPITDPGPDDDVIWDPANRCYVRRVGASESGSAAEATS